MLKVFRRLRKHLLVENKVKRYLLYAIGEIILVVIGILIAIQLNNWNEEKKAERQYYISLQNLNEEFNRTKTLLTIILEDYKLSIDAGQELMFIFEADSIQYSESKIDTLISVSLKQAPFYPLQPILDEMMVSGTIKSLPNETLKKRLFDWESTIDWLHFDYDLYLRFNVEEYNPYMTKNISWKNIDIVEGNRSFTKRSRLSGSVKLLFKELEFENLIDSNLFHSNRLHRRLVKIDALLDTILSEINASLEEK